MSIWSLNDDESGYWSVKITIPYQTILFTVIQKVLILETWNIPLLLK